MSCTARAASVAILCVAACHGGEPVAPEAGRGVAEPPATAPASDPEPSAASASSAAVASGAEQDLQRICAAVEEEQGKGRDAIATIMAVAQRWDAEVTTAGLRRAIEAVAAAVGGDRYELMRAAAAAEGVEGWQCPALEQLWASSVTD